MAEGWSDLFEEEPVDGAVCWIRSNAGCLAPSHGIFYEGVDYWTVALPSGDSIHVPYWAYRFWKLA